MKKSLRMPRLNKHGAFAAMALSFALLTTGGTIPTPLYTLWGEELGFGAGTITWVFAFYVFGTVTALVLTGGVSDQIGRRPVIIAALIVTGLATILFITGTSLPVLLLARFISGLGVGMITSAATAGLGEIYGGTNSTTPQVVATVANMGGLGLGPLIAGIFAQYLPMPTLLIFWVFLTLVIITSAFALMLPEPNENATNKWPKLRINIGVPKAAREQYWRAALAVFPTFTMLGLFSSLTPRFIYHELNIDNRAVAGFATFVLFEMGVLAQLLGRRYRSRTLVLIGLPMLICALILVIYGFENANIASFAIGTVVGGLGAGLTFSGSLRNLSAAVNHDQHAKAVATYFVAAQSALAVPVLMIGALSGELGLTLATRVILVLVITLAVSALVINALPPRKVNE